MTGGRKETVSDREILQIFAENDDPFLFTGEVADELSFSTSGTLKRLEDLNERSLLNQKKSGRVPGWWLTEKGREFLNDD